MKVRMSTEVNDQDRRAIAHFYGEKKLATYEKVKSFIEHSISCALETVTFKLEKDSPTIPRIDFSGPMIGLAFIKNCNRPIFSVREIKKGKNIGKVEVMFRKGKRLRKTKVEKRAIKEIYSDRSAGRKAVGL